MFTRSDHWTVFWTSPVNIFSFFTHTILVLSSVTETGEFVGLPIINIYIQHSNFKTMVLYSKISHNIKTNNSSFERVEDLKRLGITLTNQNSIQEGIKSRLKSGNACYHSVQNILPSSLLSKNFKIKMYRTIILPGFFLWLWNLVAHIEGGM